MKDNNTAFLALHRTAEWKHCIIHFIMHFILDIFGGYEFV